MSSSLHRGYMYRSTTFRILQYYICGTQCPEYALQHYGLLQTTTDEPLLHSMTRATFDSATNIASSMYQTAMWSPIRPSSVKTPWKSVLQPSSNYSTTRKKKKKKKKHKYENETGMRKSKKGIQYAALHKLHGQGSHTVKSRVPMCQDFRHCGFSCVTPIPHCQFLGH